MQLIRNAVARRFVLMQRKAFEAMGRFDSGGLLISLAIWASSSGS